MRAEFNGVAVSSNLLSYVHNKAQVPKSIEASFATAESNHVFVQINPPVCVECINQVGQHINPTVLNLST